MPKRRTLELYWIVTQLDQRLKKPQQRRMSLVFASRELIGILYKLSGTIRLFTIPTLPPPGNSEFQVIVTIENVLRIFKCPLEGLYHP